MSWIDWELQDMMLEKSLVIHSSAKYATGSLLGSHTTARLDGYIDVPDCVPNSNDGRLFETLRILSARIMRPTLNLKRTH